MSSEIPVGLLYSTTGTYGVIGRDCLDGALKALEEINANTAYDFSLVPKIENPGGNIDEYQRLTESILQGGQCRQIIGTVTSISRKEIIPIIEKHDVLLWYVAPYEGFECCENIIYTGACPNQHIVPLFGEVIPKFGKQAYLIGTNYVWGWEVNRIARELVTVCGGDVTGEHYLPFHSTDVERMIDTIRETRPSFVLNNLIGASSYAFFRAYFSAGKTDPFFHPDNCPIISCNLTECELDKIGYDAAKGHLSIAPYFENLETKDNEEFLTALGDRGNPPHPVSVFYVNGYVTAYYLADAIRAGGSDEIETVKAALFDKDFETPLGPTRISSRTNHAALPSYLGQICSASGFDVLSAKQTTTDADPYMVNFNAVQFAADIAAAEQRQSSSHLRVIK